MTNPSADEICLTSNCYGLLLLWSCGLALLVTTVVTVTPKGEACPSRYSHIERVTTDKQKIGRVSLYKLRGDVEEEIVQERIRYHHADEIFLLLVLQPLLLHCSLHH
jgi:hypothetical protein